ncbi:hypothetical protein LINPERPRIM_LOCUS12832 [Linum perenne]
MPVAKLKASNTTDVMKSEEGNDSLDTFIRQAMGKEPLLSFPRTNDNPVQWIQLLQALDQQDGPGWPLLTPLKVQMQKCDKCSREFCSSINYRRHVRVHHRLKKLDKVSISFETILKDVLLVQDTTKNRNLLGAFWEKCILQLSEDEAKEILSFKDVALEEVSGSSIIKSLMALNRKQGFSPLPQYCLRAGTALLDLIQGRFLHPLSSEELFSILDDASEKTFLCGAAISMQKYIFDGEASKNGLETKNIVACTSFLVEQKLVKAWLADKDAESLRCQKLLVEEEEAAQRRQAELLERKRLKKLRQKEQRAKEHQQEEKADDALEEEPAELPCSTPCSSNSRDMETPADPFSSSAEPIQLEYLEDEEEYFDLESQVGPADPGRGYYVERHPAQGNYRNRARWPQRNNHNIPNGFHGNHLNPPAHGTYRDSKPTSMANGGRKWSRKNPRVEKGLTMSQHPDDAKKREVLIGSISIALGSSSNDQQAPRKDGVLLQDKHARGDSSSTHGRSTVKQWRPVSRNGTKCETASRESQFSSQAIKAFLAERWKEAMATEHVNLVLTPSTTEPSKATGTYVHRNGNVVTPESSETRVEDSSSTIIGGGGGKGKLRAKPEKGVKLKYIPKQRTLSSPNN